MTQTAGDLRPQRHVRRRRTEPIVRAIGIIGRVFVFAGLLLLYFTGYLLWGTGVYTQKEQERAARKIEANPIVTEEKLSAGDIPAARPRSFPTLGAPLFHLEIPKIGVDTVVVEGVGREQLKKGPGHFPSCKQIRASVDCVDEAKYPGEGGNVALSGHRTTYGAPFFRVNELKKGDVIDFVSGRAKYRYRVRSQEVFDPVTGFQQVQQHGRDELTLTTCHPRFSAAQRLIVHADYEGASLVSAAPGGTVTAEARSKAQQPVVPPDVLVLASVALASALASLGLSKRYRMTAAYIAIGLGGAAGLWIGIFPRVIQLMPANY